MKITEKGEKILIKKIAEIFAELPEYTGTVHCSLYITIEGDLELSFDDPVRRELFNLFRKQYISPVKQISNFIRKFLVIFKSGDN